MDEQAESAVSKCTESLLQDVRTFRTISMFFFLFVSILLLAYYTNFMSQVTDNVN